MDYMAIASDDKDVVLYFNLFWKEHGRSASLEAFEKTMKERFGYVPGIVVNEEDSLRFRDAEHFILPIEDGVIYRSPLTRK